MGTGIYISTFFKGLATTRAKKNLRSASAVILFFQEILWHFSKIDEEDRRFRANLLLLKKFSKTTLPPPVADFNFCSVSRIFLLHQKFFYFKFYIWQNIFFLIKNNFSFQKKILKC